MKEKTGKELRRQIVHASGAMLVPLAFLFGKFLIGEASLILAFVIFLLAEHRKNNNTESRYGMKTNSKRNAEKSAQYQMNSKSKRYADEGGNRNVLKSISDKSNRIGFHSAMNSIHNVFEKFERSGENYRGAFYFYLASAVSLFLFSQQTAMLSITVLALGDSFSTAVGIFGKRKIFYNSKKTWKGTIAGFAAAFAGCFFISPALALPAAFVGMLAESLPLKIDDNLTVPILTGIALSVIAAL